MITPETHINYHLKVVFVGDDSKPIMVRLYDLSNKKERDDVDKQVENIRGHYRCFGLKIVDCEVTRIVHTKAHYDP